MRNLALVLLFILLGTLAACNNMPSGKTETPAQAQNPAPSSGAPVKAPAPKRDVGDIEASVRIEGVLAQKSEADTIEMKKLTNPKNQLDLATITVSPPVPPDIFLSFFIKSSVNFTDQPVLMRVRIMREQEVLESFSFVLGADAMAADYQYNADILKNLAAPPASLLVYAQAEAAFLPPGTDPASVNADTFTFAQGETAHISSNPVRVNFKGMAAP